MSDIDKNLIDKTINDEMDIIYDFKKFPKEKYNFFNLLRPTPYLAEIIKNINKNELKVLD